MVKASFDLDWDHRNSYSLAIGSQKKAIDCPIYEEVGAKVASLVIPWNTFGTVQTAIFSSLQR